MLCSKTVPTQHKLVKTPAQVFHQYQVKSFLMNLFLASPSVNDILVKRLCLRGISEIPLIPLRG
jgi:hypothetical protein